MTIPVPASGSTSWYTHYQQLDTQGRGAQPGPKAHTDYRTKSDGALPTYGDEGLTFTNPRTTSAQSLAASVSGGKMVGNLPNSNAASYVNQNLGAKVRRIGALFGFGSGTSGGSLCLAAWATDLTNLIPAVPDTHIHFVITPVDWGFSVFQSGSAVTLTSNTFTTPLAQDGTALRAECRIDGNTATLVLPDNTSVQLTDSRIGSITGTWASTEFYKNATGDADPVVYATWADTSPDPHGVSTPAGVARLARVAAPPTVAARWFPATAATSTPTSGGLTTIDSSLSVVQVAGPTGAVLFDMDAYMVMGSASWIIWGVSLNGNSPNHAITALPAGGIVNGNLRKSYLYPGLTAGQSYTFTWQHWAISAAAGIYVRAYSSDGHVNVFSATPV